MESTLLWVIVVSVFLLIGLLIGFRLGGRLAASPDLSWELKRLREDIARIDEKVVDSSEKQLERGERQSTEVRREVEQKLADFRTQIENTISRFQQSIGESDEQSRQLIDRLRQSLLEQIEQISRQVTEKLSGTGEMIQQLGQQLGELGKAQSELERITRGLERALGSPKAIGEFGEKILGHILRDVLPQSMFELQYNIAGNLVDAAVRVGDDKWLPIDSKFPLQNLRRAWEADNDQERNKAMREFIKDFRLRVDEISSKYIRPDKGTLDFAFMFIPSERVYFEVLSPGISRDTVGYAMEKKVLPVSPNSLFAYLSAVVVAFQGKQIERQAQRVLNSLNRLSQLLSEVEESIQKSERQTGHAKSNIEDAVGKIQRLREELDTLHRMKLERAEERGALSHAEAQPELVEFAEED